jgi:hypothetical protein
MNTQLKLLLEEMIKKKLPAEVNGIETKVTLREVEPELSFNDLDKDIKVCIMPKYIDRKQLLVVIRIMPNVFAQDVYDFSLPIDILKVEPWYEFLDETINKGVLQYIQNIIYFTQNKPVTVRHIETPLDERK